MLKIHINPMNLISTMKFAALKFQQSVVAIVAEQSGQKSASFNYFFLFPKL